MGRGFPRVLNNKGKRGCAPRGPFGPAEIVPHERGESGGKAVESARKPTAEKQETTNGPQAERGTPGGCTQPNISDPHPRRLPPRLTASDSGLILG